MAPTVTEVNIPVFPRYTSETVLTGYLIENIFTEHELQLLNRFWEQSSGQGVAGISLSITTKARPAGLLINATLLKGMTEK